MKLLTLFSFVAAGVSGYVFKIPIVPGTPKIANADWINRQKLILPLFDNVCDMSTDPAIARLAQTFDFDANAGNFKDPTVVLRLKDLVSGKGLLPKGEIFTEYKLAHVEELRAVSEVLCSAQDFHTFYSAAAWARQNVNCGLYVDAIYLAIMRRDDTEKLSVPAPYELLPNYFINKNTIITGSSLLSNVPIEVGENVRNDGNSYIIDANYTSDVDDNDEESKLAYFHEDIALNTYYFLKKLSKLSLVKDIRGTERYGEYIYHLMKQLATRYDLERYANGFDEVYAIDWNIEDSSTYDPMLVYSNGQDFKVRLRNKNSPQDIVYLGNIENSISTAVSHMIQSGSDKIQILNNLIDILVTGDKNYEDVAHQLLGTGTDDVKTTPTALDHYLTSLRDPVFWRLNKKIVNVIDDALCAIPAYTRNELYFPGVKVMNIDIKKMATSFDSFEFDVTDALDSLDSDNSFEIKIAQPRLNHKPFAIKVNITSLVAQRGLMKVFLGPKMMPGELVLKKNTFMLLDTCEITLKKGGNIVTRTSEQISNLAPDFLSLKALRQNLEDAEFGIGNLPLENLQSLTGFPSRLIIPKGTEEGLSLQIFVFIAPFAKINIATSVTEFNSAILSPNYPLDLPIDDSQLFDMPNVMVKEILVTHKGSSGAKYEGGKSKSWNGETYDYTSSKKEYGQKSYAENRFVQQPNQPYFETEKVTDMTITTEKHYLLQMRPQMDSFEKSKKQDKNRTDFSSKLTETLLYNNEKAVGEAAIQSHPMLGKKSFSLGTKKDLNKYTKDTNEIPSVDVNKNLNYGITSNTLKKPEKKSFDMDTTKVINKDVTDSNETVSINIDKNWDTKFTPSSKVDTNIGKPDTKTNVNINIDKINDNIFTKPNYSDTSKTTVKINKEKELTITEKSITGDGSLVSRDDIHDDIEDIIDKYFIPKQDQEPESTKKTPTVYDYLLDTYNDYGINKPKVYE